MNNSLYLKQIVYNQPSNPTTFPFNLPSISSLNKLLFDQPVTLFIGENGTGKSTIIEAIAGLMGLNLEGGSKNNSFSSYQENHLLIEQCRLIRYPKYPKDSYFSEQNLITI